MLCASASFATMSAFVKAVRESLPVSQLIFFRCLLPLPFFLYVIHSKKKGMVVHAKITVFFRSLFGFLAMAGFYYALTHMPLADCIFIGRAQPFLLALLAPFIVKESTPRSAWLAIFAGLSGVALIMQPSLYFSSAAWVAFLASACAAIAHLMVRKLNRTDDPSVIVFNFFVLTAIFSGSWSMTSLVFPSFHQWLQIVGIAFFATVGQFLMTLAYRFDQAPAVAAASYSSVVLSVVYGYWFWGEVPHPLVWLGALLILSGAANLFYSRIRGVHA